MSDLKSFGELAELINDAQADAEKAYAGNKSAATRLRATMQQVKDKAQAVRQEALDASKAGKDKA